MLTATVRVKGERDTWWRDVVRLLSGRGIRRNDPERLAVESAVGTLRARLAARATNGRLPPIGLAISHDGVGPRRAVTAVAFADDPRPPERAP